jgi:hypothetical protein
MSARPIFFCLAGLWMITPATARAEEPLFGRQVVPVLYKLGCSSGQCHGAFSGKGNFRLSLFAAEPQADYGEVLGPYARRINRQDADESLLLLKPTGRLPHGGGLRLQLGSPEYELLKRWITAGAPYDPAAEGRVVSVRVEPSAVTARTDAAPVPLRVLARLDNGQEEDVTRFARFEPFDPTIVTVDEAGRVSGQRSGDAHVLAHYAGQIGFTIVAVPGEMPAGLRFPDEPLSDSIDRMVVDKLRRLNIVPSPLCSDSDFLRRAHLDITGQLPTPDEVRRFLADPAADKRAKKIDELLTHPLHAAVWATKLCDITGADNRVMYDRAVYNFHDWYRHKLETNRPWDEIVRGVLTATAADGRSLEELASTAKKPPDARSAPSNPTVKPWQTGYGARNTLDVFFDNNKFRVQAGPDKGKIDPQPIALHAASAFLGVRLECAECHKHPHDRWTQNDFFGFSAAFSYINRGVDPALRQKNITVNGIHVTQTPLMTFTNTRTREPVGPRVLGGQPIEVKVGVDPRAEVWKWMVAPENPYFARSMVNRLWAHYFGRGLYNPVDAQSAGNPPSHPDVLDELVRDFVASKYDLRHLHRRILNTRTYQRSWETNATNARDERNFSHRVLRRMTAEQVVDAVAQVTGTPVALAPVYSGDPNRKFERAIEYPLSRPGGADGYLLKIFDRPQRTQSCDCERSEAPNLSQSLYFYNDAALIARITDSKGRLAGLLTSQPDDDKLLEELYLLTLSRLPTPAEVERGQKHLKTAKSRAEGFEDLLWSLLNRQEFLVTH